MNQICDVIFSYQEDQALLSVENQDDPRTYPQPFAREKKEIRKSVPHSFLHPQRCVPVLTVSSSCREFSDTEALHSEVSLSFYPVYADSLDQPLENL